MLQIILFSCCVFTLGYAFANAARLVRYCDLIEAALDKDLLPKKEMEAVDKILKRMLFLIVAIVFLAMLLSVQ